MSFGYELGQIVQVKAFPDEVLARRVVGFNEKYQVVHLCNEWEYQAAIAQEREPNCMGFPLADIITPPTPTRPEDRENL